MQGLAPKAWRVIRTADELRAVMDEVDAMEIGDGIVFSIEPYPNKTCPQGLSDHPLYSTWNNMMARCYKPELEVYKNYGGRGICVCEEWHDFLGFLLGVGPRPGPEYSLDRVDVNGNYEPGNCRWATPAQQANNTRWNVFIEWRGERKTISQWARAIGISVNILHHRIRRAGMSIEEAANMPVIKRDKYRGKDRAKRRKRGSRVGG